MESAWFVEIEFDMAYAAEMLGFRYPRSRYDWVDHTIPVVNLNFGSFWHMIKIDQILLLT